MVVNKSIVWYLTSRNDLCYKRSTLKKNGAKKSDLGILEQLAFKTRVPKVASSYVFSHEKPTI